MLNRYNKVIGLLPQNFPTKLIFFPRASNRTESTLVFQKKLTEKLENKANKMVLAITIRKKQKMSGYKDSQIYVINNTYMRQ